MEKILFSFATGAGGGSEKEGPVYGEILQARWKYASDDTGGQIALQIVPDIGADEAGDTGLNITFTVAEPRFRQLAARAAHPVVGPGILDTGVGDLREPVFVTMEHVKAMLTPGGANGTTGRLWLTVGKWR
jgi:hypothetical protein